MCQPMLNPNTQGPDDDCFTAGMLDLVLKHASPTSFGLLKVIPAPYVGHRINDIKMIVASLGEVKSRSQQKALCAVS